MKFIILLCVVALAASEDTYSNENDDLDIEAVIANDDKLKAFNDCFLDTASCDDVQADFKKDLREAVEQACTKCTSAQKHILKRFLEGLKEKQPQGYQDFKKKYDPENKFFTALEAAIAKA